MRKNSEVAILACNLTREQLIKGMGKTLVTEDRVQGKNFEESGEREREKEKERERAIN